MSDSVRPHRRQPTRLPHPWDSPGRNTGVGYHFLLQCMKMKSESEVTQSCLTLSDPMDYSPPGSSIHGIFQARALELGAMAFSSMSELVTIFFNFYATAMATAKWRLTYHLPAHNSRILTCGAEKAMAPHSSTLAWKIPWMEEPGGL